MAREVALQHGWGWDASGWENWWRLAPAGWRISAAERGYFGAEPAALAPAATVVCHSFGLHLAPPAVVEGAALLVIIGGFARFHGDGRNSGGDGERTRPTLRRMRRRLGREPVALLRDFRVTCHAPRPAPEAALDRFGRGAERWNQDLLRADLERLDRDDGLKALPGGHVLILHGVADEVVTPARAEALQAAWPGAELVLHPAGGHALHVDQAGWCWARVAEAWDAL